MRKKKVILGLIMATVISLGTIVGNTSISYGMENPATQETDKDVSVESVSAEAVEVTGEAAKIGSIHNPIFVSADLLEFSYVYFGNYPQSEVTGQALIEEITDATYNENGDAVVNHEKYCRMKADEETYRYFVYEPIRWRVICRKDNEAILQSDVILDCQKYCDENSWKWVDSSLRKWLNDYNVDKVGFLEQAFTHEEASAINAKRYVDDEKYNGYSYSRDKVFLLSGAELYGMGRMQYPGHLKTQASDYAFANGVVGDVQSGYARWWVRNNGNEHVGKYGGYVDENGVRYDAIIGANGWYANHHLKPVLKDTEGIGVCPTIVLDLSKVQVWGTEEEIQNGILPARGEDVPYMDTGKCGENVYYRVEDDEVYIWGTGDMYDYEKGVASPFHATSHIRKVVIEEGVESVGNRMFFETTNLEEVILPDTIKEIGDYAFVGWNNLSKINFPKQLVKIGKCAFNRTKLIEVNLPDSVTWIGGGAFSGCATLTKLKLPSNLEIINNSLCSDCNLKEIVIPEQVTSIGDYAFAGLEGLETIIIPNKVGSIGIRAFANCNNLEYVVIPETVTSIGEEAFIDTKWMENQRQQNPYVTVNEILIDMNACTGEAVIPDTVKQIAKGVIRDLKEIDKIVIPSTVKKIRYEAFIKGPWREYIHKIYVMEGSMAEQHMKEEYGEGYYIIKNNGEIQLAGSEGNNSSMPSESQPPSDVPMPDESPQPVTKQIQVGDVDGDEQITLKDAQFILKIALKIEKDVETVVVDADEDKSITLTDAQIILKAALKIIPWDKKVEIVVSFDGEKLTEEIKEIQTVVVPEESQSTWEPFLVRYKDPVFYYIGNRC